MNRATRISGFTRDGSERVVHVWRTVNSQPSWLTRAVLLAFMIVIGIPFLLLIAFALLVATLVFGVLWFANRALAGLRSILPRDDGRENVRVIKRNEER